MRRWVFRVTVFLLVAAVAYIGVTFAQVVLASRQDQVAAARRQADERGTPLAAVVLGAAQYQGRPSPVLRARLDHALSLYRAHRADLIVVTGGGQPGEQFTEAGASADYLIGHGVPDADILREVQGRTSWQSLASAANVILKPRGITVALLVSDPFHSSRIRAIADELGLDGYSSPTRTSPIAGSSTLPYFAKETAAVAVGRVVGFRREAGIDTKITRVRQERRTG